MKFASAYAWVRACVWYPVRVYGNRLYLENLNRFRFSPDTDRYGRLRFLRWFSDYEKVSVLALFGYNQIGIQLHVDLELKDYEDMFAAIKTAIERIIKGYQKFKEYFLKEVCPLNIQEVKDEKFDFKAEKLLIDVSEFLIRIDTKQRNAIIQKMYKFLQNYSSDINFVLFDSALRKPVAKKPEKESVFYEVYVIIESIRLFIYHYLTTGALSLDPSKSILDICRCGFLSSMALLDIHYDLEEFYRLISEERSKLSELNKRRFPLGLDIHEEKVVQLRKQAMDIENNLEELISLSSEINESLRKPYDFSVKSDEIPEYASTVIGLVNNMNSSPYSQFEAAGILETYELGGLRRVKESVDELDFNLRTLQVHYARVMNFVQMGILISLTFILFVIIWFFNINLGSVADILQIATFFLALLLLLINIGHYSIFKGFRHQKGHKK